MTTGISNWVHMEQPEQRIEDLFVSDGRGVMSVADIEDSELDLEGVHMEAWVTPVRDLRPMAFGPVAVVIGDDDDVLYFRTPYAAQVFASSYIDGPVTFEDGIAAQVAA